MQKKLVDKIQHPFIIKTLSKVVVEGTYINIIKAIYEHPLPVSTLQEKTTNIPLKIRNKTEMATFTSCTQHTTGSPNHGNQTRRNKRHPDWKGRSKTVYLQMT